MRHCNIQYSLSLSNLRNLSFSIFYKMLNILHDFIQDTKSVTETLAFFRNNKTLQATSEAVAALSSSWSPRANPVYFWTLAGPLSSLRTLGWIESREWRRSSPTGGCPHIVFFVLASWESETSLHSSRFSVDVSWRSPIRYSLVHSWRWPRWSHGAMLHEPLAAHDPVIWASILRGDKRRRGVSLFARRGKHSSHKETGA